MGFKIVINKCYGGFGISPRGIEWLLAKGADPAKVRVQDSGLGELRFVYTVCLLERHDPLLVEMVETLGEAANGDSAALEIKEINQPLYRIEKVPERARRQGAYAVIAANGLILRRGHDLGRVIRVLDRNLRIVGAD